MSTIANKRELAESVHVLVKKNDPDVGDLVAVTDALARVMSDILGCECRISLRVGADALDAARAAGEVR